MARAFLLYILVAYPFAYLYSSLDTLSQRTPRQLVGPWKLLKVSLLFFFFSFVVHVFPILAIIFIHVWLKKTMPRVLHSCLYLANCHLATAFLANYHLANCNYFSCKLSSCKLHSFILQIVILQIIFSLFGARPSITILLLLERRCI